MINEKIRKLEESQQTPKEAPQGGVPLLPLMPATHSYKHETTMTKEVKVEYGQPIMRPAAILPTVTQPLRRSPSPSPKPSAEGLAMEKLWTPTHVSGYESCASDFEPSHKTEHETETKHFEHEIKVQKLPTPTTELSAPFLVKQVAKSIPISIPVAKEKSALDDIQLVPGSPPEICFAPKSEVRRQSLVEAMEKSLEQCVLHGPSKVLPYSVPTLTPPVNARTTTPTKQPPPIVMCTPPPPEEYKQQAYHPPPPVLPTKLGRGEFYESDYESDRWKYSGSESDEASFRPVAGVQRPKSMDGIPATATYQPFKTSGYAADTEDISSYRKMESMQESRSYFETSTSSIKPTQQAQQPLFSTPLEKPAPTQTYFSSQNEHDKQEYSSQNEFKREEKDYKCTSSMTSSYNISSSSSTGPKFQPTPIKAPVAPSPVLTKRKTPVEFSDYSSEVDERFRSLSRTYESDNELKGYRVVFPPTPTPKTHLVNGHKSPVVVVTPSPMEFEPTPPTVSTYQRPKFEPIQKEIRHEIKTETMQQKKLFQQQPPQQVFKPKPVAAKFIAATQQQQQQQQPQQQPQPQTRPTMYYKGIAGTPLHTAKMATETKNVMHMKESSETCERVVNMQQTKRVIHFDKQKEETTMSSTTPLEPFPYTVSPSRSTPARQVRVPPPPTPTKFIPGEFRESEYENELENAKIRPLWTPHGEWGPLGYRHVEPPRPGRSCSLPRTYERVLSPMEFDSGPEMPSKIQVDINSLRKERGGSIGAQHKTQSLNRHSTMRSNYSQRYQPSTVYEQEQYPQNFPRDDMNLKIGSPPKYGFIQAHADTHAKRIGSTFLQKSHQFIEDITKDLHKSTKTTTTVVSEPKVITHAFRPGFKRAPSEGDNKPQAYRDETRVSQYGTKCVDPNTGLIYFKYDFGYEFGILFPGEGRKFVGGQWNSSSSSLPQTATKATITPTKQIQAGTGRKSPYPLNFPGGGDLNIPVQHEHTTTAHTGPTRIQTYGLGSNPNLCSNSAQNGFHSDTDTRRRSPVVGIGGVNRLKKRYSLPNTQYIDINIDRLHANDALTHLPLIRTVTELPADIPVNAHLNRDEHPQKPPVFITPLKDIAVVTGQIARFECIVQCHPQPIVTWSKNGIELQNSSKHIIEYRNGVCRLTLSQAYPDDAGVYSCTAANPLGTATTSGQMQVQGINRSIRC